MEQIKEQMQMNEVKNSTLSVEAQKAKIRQRYRGIDTGLIEIIPCITQEDFYNSTSEKRVAVYARVSTDEINQTSSYELQKNHYEDMINKRPNWTLVDIYADEGISGTSLQHRDAFKRLMRDCDAGKIDMIITKSVSRFARNIVDCIDNARHLLALNPPVAIFFETEGIYTLKEDYESSLAFVSTMAQEESHTKSKAMERSIDMRFERGIFLTPVLLGYDHDEVGNLVINEEEAKTVRLIFFMYLYGYSTSQIAEQLNILQRPTKLNNTNWTASTVLGILQNERRCGDVLARKTFTPNFLNHKSKKNINQRTKYYRKEHHVGIISRDDYIAVQRMIRNAKYGHKGFLPELKIISEGSLKGFVSINPRWAAFKADDYKAASASVFDKNKINNDLMVEVNDGDFNMTGFEIVRSQFLNFANKVSITISSHKLKFSTQSIRKLNSYYIELFVNPDLGLLVVKSAKETDKNSVKWLKIIKDKKLPREIAGSAFLPNIFDLFEWDKNCKYRLTGNRHSSENEDILVFDTNDVEMLIPGTIKNKAADYFDSDCFDKDLTPMGIKSNVIGYPANWDKTFGKQYYTHKQANERFASLITSDTMVSYNPEPLNVTEPSEVKFYKYTNSVNAGGTK